MDKWIGMLKDGFKKCADALGRSTFTIALALCLLMVGGAAYLSNTAARTPTPARVLGTPSPVVMTPESVETLPEAQLRLDAMEPQLLWPVSGHQILRAHDEHAPQYNETLAQWELHMGLDISAQMGEAVLAALSGTVGAAYKDARLGYTVELNHEGGYTTRYANLQSLNLVTLGSAVLRGQEIGAVGDSASAESLMEPHLHYEAYHGGAWALPLPDAQANAEHPEYDESPVE